MSQSIGVKIPDIGDFKEVEVIEILVAEGDTITEEQSLITVESDKASMEIPSSHAGVVKSLKVKIGDKIAEGAVVLELEPASGKADIPAQAEHATPAGDDDAADAASPAGEASAAAQDAPETADTPASPGRSSERDAGNEREPAAQAHILSG